MTIKDMLDWLDMLDPLFKQIGSTIKGPVWLGWFESNIWANLGQWLVPRLYSWQHMEEHIMPTQTLVIDIDWTIGNYDIPQKTMNRHRRFFRVMRNSNHLETRILATDLNLRFKDIQGVPRLLLAIFSKCI